MNAVDLDAVSMALKGMDQSISDKFWVFSQKKQAMFEPVEGAVLSVTWIMLERPLFQLQNKWKKMKPSLRIYLEAIP